MGWMHEVSSELVMRPSMFVKTDQISTQIDFNINVMYADHLWGGVTYRLDDAVVLIAGYNINENLKFGYAYDITTSDLSLNRVVHMKYYYDILSKCVHQERCLRIIEIFVIIKEWLY